MLRNKASGGAYLARVFLLDYYPGTKLDSSWAEKELWPWIDPISELSFFLTCKGFYQRQRPGLRERLFQRARLLTDAVQLLVDRSWASNCWHHVFDSRRPTFDVRGDQKNSNVILLHGRQENLYQYGERCCPSLYQYGIQRSLMAFVHGQKTNVLEHLAHISLGGLSNKEWGFYFLHAIAAFAVHSFSLFTELQMRCEKEVAPAIIRNAAHYAATIGDISGLKYLDYKHTELFHQYCTNSLLEDAARGKSFECVMYVHALAVKRDAQTTCPINSSLLKWMIPRMDDHTWHGFDTMARYIDTRTGSMTNEEKTKMLEHAYKSGVSGQSLVRLVHSVGAPLSPNTAYSLLSAMIPFEDEDVRWHMFDDMVRYYKQQPGSMTNEEKMRLLYYILNSGSKLDVVRSLVHRTGAQMNMWILEQCLVRTSVEMLRTLVVTYPENELWGELILWILPRVQSFSDHFLSHVFNIIASVAPASLLTDELEKVLQDHGKFKTSSFIADYRRLNDK